jgi:hypothetical protein
LDHKERYNLGLPLEPMRPEDLAKLKLGKAAAAIVSIGDRKLDLLKAEASSSFKEVITS